MLSGLGALSPDVIRREIRDGRARTDWPFGVNLLLNASPGALQPCLAACLEEGVSAVSFFWDDPAPHVRACHRAGAVVLACVGSVGEARLAAATSVGVVAAQGWEAGGHVRGEVSTLALVPRVVDAVAPLPVLADGGIAHGRGLAAALTLGPAGAYAGTALLLAEEAARRSPSGQRPGEEQIVAASPRGPIPRYRTTVASVDVERDVETMPLWAGQGVGLAVRAGQRPRSSPTWRPAPR